MDQRHRLSLRLLLLLSAWHLLQACLPATPQTLTPTRDPNAVCTPNAEVVCAPNGRRYATRSTGEVIDFDRGRFNLRDETHPKFVKFAWWTPDSRYAIFIDHDQYGNQATMVFDTSEWKLTTTRVPNCEYANTGGMCQGGPITSYGSGLLLRGDGMLLGFPELTPLRSILSAEANVVLEAAWSPDGAHLAFIGAAGAYPLDYHNFALYWAQGDGTASQPLFSLEAGVAYTPPLWSTDSQSFTFMAGGKHYVFDVRTGEIREPESTSTPE